MEMHAVRDLEVSSEIYTASIAFGTAVADLNYWLHIQKVVALIVKAKQNLQETTGQIYRDAQARDLEDR